MPITAHISETEKAGENFHLLLVGPEQSGKSLLASTAPKPVLFMDYDLKAASLHGRKGVYALSIAEDASKPFNQPTAFVEGLTVIEKLEQGDLKLSAASANFKTDDKVRTLVFDSTYTLGKAAQGYALYTNQKELAYTINIGGKMQVMVPKSWHGWGAEVAETENMLLRAFAMNLNVIVIMHEVPEEAPGSTEDRPIYTGKVVAYPVRYNKAIVKYFPDIWHLTREYGKLPTISVNPDGKLVKCGNTMDITNVATPDISEIIRIARDGGAK